MREQRSSLTAYGQRLLRELNAMGIEARYAATEDEQQFLALTNARGVTSFWGDNAASTQVLLRADANDATVYEEYLHVLEGQGRGWVSVDNSTEALIEEVRVGRQILDHADELSMTSIERSEIERTLRGYLQALKEKGVDLP